MKTSSVEFISHHLPLHLWKVNIDGLQCSGKSSSPGSGNGGKREIVLNRRPELYRGKYRCVQPKINLLKRRSYACETQCFPVEPSGFLVCSVFLYVSDSPLVSMEKEKRRKYRCGQRTVRLAVVACSQKPSSLRAQAQLTETRTETVETFELVKVEPKL
ncbi:hypothetical protein TNCV_5090861 [Trichonephila clavipes]|nr:hypothetical protein TNCV_5090861 [Trichonephila clavipes]